MDDGLLDATDERWQPTRIVGDPTITLRYPLEDEDGKILVKAGTVMRVSAIYITEHGLGVDVYDPAGGNDGYHIDEWYPWSSPWEPPQRWFSWGGKLDDGKETFVNPPMVAYRIVREMQERGDVSPWDVLEEMQRRLKGVI